MAGSDIPIPRKLWEHPNPKGTKMYKFMQNVNQRRNLTLNSFNDLYSYSIKNRASFWQDVWELLPLVHEGTYTKVVDESAPMDTIPYWFEGTRLNFAENILYNAGSDHSQLSTRGKEDSKIACTEVREGGTELRDVTWADLRKRVGRLSNALRAKGVKKGDRICVVASNSVDTLVVFLATTALGGLFSSSSTDMGTNGILDRLLQVTPKYVFIDDWTVYNGKTIDLRPKMKEIVEGMQGVENFEGIISQPRFRQPADIASVPQTTTLETFLAAAQDNTELTFERVAFRDPFMIVYSSGTTGMPKCIVHSVGGVLLSSLKEGQLHYSYGPDTVKLQFTTTGWIMYLSAVGSLLHSVRLVLYDGSPFQPDLKTFITLVGSQRVTHLGISPRYMAELQKASIVPRTTTDLSNLRLVTSTGMVLSDALFEWFYDTAFPRHVHLCNISGGTDLAGCFGIGNPLTPVYVGGTQGPTLGLQVEVYDQTIPTGKRGTAVEDGVPGELVATTAFPNQPTTFWGQGGHEKYLSSYFQRYPQVWAHGDFIVKHPQTGSITFLGRADGVLNPSGVRFGSAEIYSVIEEHFPQIQDSICVGQRRPSDNDESVMLFLLMQPGQRFSEELVREVKVKIGSERSKRHVPKWVFETPAIPTTVNLKKVELPVKQIVSGQIIKPSGTLLNPDSLKYYYQFAKVEQLGAPKSKL
ncbi:acetoacetyl-CoA synthetase-like protein [Pseudovirgaria hyperparasitica]|uniref:Acetoacetyl-CoA synthetase-like protein n=1 Tax=Pseudovirgaria hyperparasitica TaxID=470096 RepID=A0A6A6VTM2_9PEZI|nr:acetoacetyl-CoA synthetase-like protein [Pseudovirgaria hyperparasitica]KAF2754038.1 acetoacetyl-CoA synthetase-like protein [Pseudovirgaria hyperparasitica]